MTTNILPAGSKLLPGQSLTSTDGGFILVMQLDGNLVEYRVLDHAVLWSTGTANNPGAYAYMQGDGNFVVYSLASVALWASNTKTPGSYLVLQDDANLVMMGPIWSTGK